MPTNRLQLLTVFAAMFVLALPALTRAGDAPVFVLGDWGIGEIDGKYMLYTGRNSYVFTPIPTLPRGPLWNHAYNAFPFVVSGSAALWLYRRRKNKIAKLTATAERPSEV